MSIEESDEVASARGTRVTGLLEQAAAKFGLRARREYPIPGGRLDVVWLWNSPIPGVEGDLPIVAFEVESSWRTRKHIKGDLLNLQDAGPLVGVLVLLGDGREVESTRRFASQLANRPGWRIVVWSEDDVQALLKSDTSRTGLNAVRDAPQASTHGRSSAVAVADASAATAESYRHHGKYQALWHWLLQQQSSPVVATFAEIEAVLGFSLPPSSRRHLPHWYGYAGTAVGRAIRDSGWRVRDVDLTEETVVFDRAPEQVTDVP